MNTLEGEGFSKAIELLKSEYRPKEILELQLEIQSDICTARQIREATGVQNFKLILSIIQKQRKLDALYEGWIAGTIS
jgi:hypothetical protein